MDSRITALLSSTNPQDRKKAIKRLVEVGDQEALRTLAEIYKYEANPDIKALALQAGKLIKNQSGGLNRTSLTLSVDDIIDEEPEKAKRTPISAQDQAWAKGMLDRAIDMSLQGEHDKAVASLIKAFKTNPNYHMDSYAMRSALEITQMSKADFFALLNDKQQIEETIHDAKQRVIKEKEKQNIRVLPDVPWENVTSSLAFYFVLTAGLVMMGLLGGWYIYNTALTTTAQTCPSCSADDVKHLHEALTAYRFWQALSPVQSALFGVLVGGIAILYMTIYFGAIHTMAMGLISPDGSYRAVVYRGARALMIGYGLAGSLIAIGLLMMMREQMTPLFVTLYGANSLSNISPLWPLLTTAGIGVMLGGTIHLARVIANCYQGSWVQISFIIYLSQAITSAVILYLAKAFVPLT